MDSGRVWGPSARGVLNRSAVLGGSGGTHISGLDTRWTAGALTPEPLLDSWESAPDGGSG